MKSLVFAANWKALRAWDRSPRWICDVVARNCFFSNCVETDAAKTRRSAYEVFIDYFLRKTDRFKYLCAGV